MTTVQMYYTYLYWSLCRDIGWVQGHGWVTGLDAMNRGLLK